jgi:hypothetical protein
MVCGGKLRGYKSYKKFPSTYPLFLNYPPPSAPATQKKIRGRERERKSESEREGEREREEEEDAITVDCGPL